VRQGRRLIAESPIAAIVAEAYYPGIGTSSQADAD
jgi:hypothetical protein